MSRKERATLASAVEFAIIYLFHLPFELELLLDLARLARFLVLRQKR